MKTLTTGEGEGRSRGGRASLDKLLSRGAGWAMGQGMGKRKSAGSQIGNGEQEHVYEQSCSYWGL